MSDQHVIAVDLGADSGRVMKVRFDGERFHQEDVHRFPNIPVNAGGTLYWDVLRLWHEIAFGIEKASSGARSIGVDAWGVDFALLDRQGRLVANPVHYRDQRTEGMAEWVYQRIPKRELFERTGLQFMILNTVYQLASLVRDQSPWLESAHSYLAFPDLINYWLTGEKACEYTHATTTQVYNPRKGEWDWQTLDDLGIPSSWFGRIIQPGTRLGAYNGIPVIVPASHDTASAVVGVPTTGTDYAYLSSGTWSLIGLELPTPVINDAVFEANITNEGGVDGTFRFLKNVVGMWLAQQSRYTWRAQGSEYSYDDLTQAAAQAEPFRSLIDPDDLLFLAPGDIPSRIREFCARTHQPIPESVGQVMRTIYESLALKYRFFLDKMADLSGHTVNRLHIIGGGSQNRLLCQMTADAIKRQVVAGPAEATALGNAVVQYIALGEIGSIAQARELLSRTTDTVVYEPKHSAAWDDAFGRFEKLLLP
ncbi:rhamnulokinase family protein [Kamptonema cortianum]|nr:rhamnulokinase family protein [Kamptonema cortianum]